MPSEAVPSDGVTSTRVERARRGVVRVLVVTLLAVTLRLLEFELAHLRYHDMVRAFMEVSRTQIMLAALCTVAAYAVLPGYDVLALYYAGHRLPLRRVL